MIIHLQGTPDEIAALVLGVQERQVGKKINDQAMKDAFEHALSNAHERSTGDLKIQVDAKEMAWATQSK